jgi:prephenate dehydrogenase
LERLGTVAIVGVGLIGGSIGLALRARGRAEYVLGVGRDPAKLAEACRLGAIDEPTTDLIRASVRAEVLVVCTPVTRIAEDVVAAAAAGGDLLITDAGSTKGTVVEAIERDERASRVFVGAHPIAGSERQGVAHARADLFADRTCVLTPTGATPADRLRRARAFWSALGCHLVEMTPEAHDRALALTSHLPHAVASALAGLVPSELLPLTGGAYKDGTRVASADATLWTGIFLENQRPLLQAIDGFQQRLLGFRQALERCDGVSIENWWSAATRLQRTEGRERERED